MAKGRTYKALTKAQTKTALELAQAGKSQKVIAKTLGVAKQRVATVLKAKAVGKRVASEFWGDVKTIQRLEDITWKQAVHKVKHRPYYVHKRAIKKHKKYKTFDEFWEEQLALDKTQKERLEALAEEMEEYEFAS